jgi:hypothetical protein
MEFLAQDTRFVSLYEILEWIAKRVSDFGAVFGTIILTKRQRVTHDDPTSSQGSLG